MSAFPRSAVFPLPNGAAAGGISNKKLEEELAKYFLLAGRPLVQKAIFGTAAGAEGRLVSTSNATKGLIIFGEASDLIYNEATGRIGVGTAVPSARLTIIGKNGTNSKSVAGEAERGLFFTGGHGGNANAEGAGPTATAALGGGLSTSTGTGGNAEGGTETNTAGGAGNMAWETSEGGTAFNSSTAKKGFGGAGGRIFFLTGVGGPATAASELNEAGAGGDLEMEVGSGGNAEGGATNTAGRGGNIILLAGGGGQTFGGGVNTNGKGGEVKIVAGTSKGAAKAGNAILKAGYNVGGAGEAVCGSVELIAGLLAAAPGFVLTGEGKIALYRGTAPVAQHAAIANPIEELKSVRAKLEEVIAALKAIGITA